jgi:hypothetical protein
MVIARQFIAGEQNGKHNRVPSGRPKETPILFSRPDGTQYFYGAITQQ